MIDHEPATHLPSTTRTIETDVCVVGGGLIGLIHAHEARRRGLSVVLLERDVRAIGASVRHAGHLFFSALASGDALDSALLARKRWIDLGRRAGADMEDAGTLVVAHNREELAVMEEAAANQTRCARVLSRAEGWKRAPVSLDGVVGGLHASRDLRIEPRAATAALARLLMHDPSARIEWTAPVHEIESGVVHSGALRVRAQAIVVCPGAGHFSLPPPFWSRHDQELVLHRTQMLRLAAPTGRRYRPTITTGMSLLQHPGFAEQQGADALRARLELEQTELVEDGIQLLVAHLPSGDLVIGEARTEADAPPSPFGVERLYRLLLDEAQRLLGVLPEIRQRWLATEVGVKASDTRDFVVTSPQPGVRIVHGVSGRDLALAPVKAARILDELLIPRSIAEIESAAVPEIVVSDVRGRGGVRAHPDAFRVRRVTPT